MPNLSPVVISDSLTPRTFNPRGIDANGVATLVESNGVPVADRRLTVARTRTQNGREKVTYRFTLPVVQTETENGISNPKVVRTAYADLTFSYDSTSSSSERLATRFLVYSLLADPVAGATNDELGTLF